MASGGLYGGMAVGLMGALDYANKNRALDLEEERNARLNQLADMQIQDAKDKQAATQQVADLGRQQSADAQLAATPAADRQANLDAALSRNAGLVAGTETMEGDQPAVPLTDSQKADIAKAYGVGLPSDDVRRYQYGLKKAQVYEDAGQIDLAKKVRDEAQDQAAGAWMQGILGKDARRVKELYNLYPNGHQVSNVGFDDKGNVLVTDDKGTRTMDKYDAVAQGLAVMKPEMSAKFIETQLSARERSEFMDRWKVMQDDLHRREVAAKEAAVLGRAGGGPGGVAGSRAAGVAAGGAANAPEPEKRGLFALQGISKDKDAADFVERWAGKPDNPPVINDAKGNAVKVDGQTYRNEFEAIASDMAEAGGGKLNSGEVGAAASRIARNKYVKDDNVVIRPVVDPSGSVGLNATVDGRTFRLGKRDMNDAEIGRYFDTKTEDGALGLKKVQAERDAIRTENEAQKNETIFANKDLYQRAIRYKMEEARQAGKPMTEDEVKNAFDSTLVLSRDAADKKRKAWQDLNKSIGNEGGAAPGPGKPTQRTASDAELVSTAKVLGTPPKPLDVVGGLKRVFEWANRGSTEAHLSDLRAKLQAKASIEPAWAGIYLKAAEAATPEQRARYGITQETIDALKVQSRMTPADIQASGQATAAASVAARTQTGQIR